MAFFRDVLPDVRYAARTLSRAPAFTLMAVLTLALGIGATTTIFGVVNGVLLEPLPYPEANRIVLVATRWLDGRRITPRLSGGDLQDVARDGSVFDAVSAVYGGEVGVQLGPRADFTAAFFVTPPFFQVFDARPIRGRVFAPSEAGRAVMVSAAFAERNFGSVDAALGQTLGIDKQPFEIVGVLDWTFRYPARAEVWAAAPMEPTVLERSSFNYPTVARLRAGTGLEAASARLDTLGAQLANAHPAVNRNKRFVPIPLREHLVGQVRNTLYLLFGAVAMVLLIACANVSNLLLARATARRRELSVRAALGAGRWRIVRQLVVETMVLAAAAGAAGLALAHAGTAALVWLAPPDVPRIADIHVNGFVALFAVVVSGLTTMLAGLVPAWQVSRVDLNEALRQSGSRGSVGSGSARSRSVLLVGEIATAVVLAIVAGLLFRSFLTLGAVDLGYRPERLLVMYAHAPAASDDDYVRVARELNEVLPELAAVPGARAAAAVMGLPTGQYSSFGSYAVEGKHTFAPGQPLPAAGFRLTSPGYFETMGMSVRQGRDFRMADADGAPRVAIISQALARETFPAENPIGRRIQCGLDSLEPMTIVGVVGDVRHESPAAAPGPQLYMPLMQHPSRANEVQYVLRTAADPLTIAGTARDVMRRRFPDAATRVTTMEAMVAGSVATPRFRTVLVGAFALVALLLAMAGVFAVMHYVTAQRAAEFAVRTALGARPADVLRLVLGTALALGCAGLVTGVAVSAALSGLLRSLLFGLAPVDPATYATVAAIVLGVTGVAAALPAWRASRVDPASVLREG
jgi:putative ABC transport system permease protein